MWTLLYRSVSVCVGRHIINAISLLSCVWWVIVAMICLLSLEVTLSHAPAGITIGLSLTQKFSNKISSKGRLTKNWLDILTWHVYDMVLRWGKHFCNHQLLCEGVSRGRENIVCLLLVRSPLVSYIFSHNIVGRHLSHTKIATAKNVRCCHKDKISEDTVRSKEGYCRR